MDQKKKKITKTIKNLNENANPKNKSNSKYF